MDFVKMLQDNLFSEWTDLDLQMPDVESVYRYINRVLEWQLIDLRNLQSEEYSHLRKDK